MSTRGRFLVAAVALIVVGAGGWYWASSRNHGPQSQAGGAGPTVVAAAAMTGDVALTFDAVGTLRANEAVTVTSKTTGIVKSVLILGIGERSHVR